MNIYFMHVKNKYSSKANKLACLEHRNTKRRNEKKRRNEENTGMEKVRKPHEFKT